MSERIYCPGPVAPPKRQSATGNPAAHDSHVVGKNRYHGDRDGEITYYLVGPQRATFKEAEDDLSRFEGAGQQAGALAALRGALDGVLVALRSCVGKDDQGNDRFVVPETRRAVEVADAALATNAGRLEAEVLQAAVLMADATEYWLEFDNEAQVHVCIHCGVHGERLEDIVHEDDCPIKVFVAYRDALLAARGGEG